MSERQTLVQRKEHRVRYQQPGILNTVFGAGGAVERSGCYEPNIRFESWQLGSPTTKSESVMTKVKCVSNFFIDKY